MNVNIARTRAYYSTLDGAALCNCAYCRSYRSQVRAAFPAVSAYLESLGIDIQKPFETSPLEPDEQGILEYCGCQYIVFGTCEPEFHHRIGPAEFRFAPSHPSTGIAEKHFVLELFPIRLKFLP